MRTSRSNQWDRGFICGVLFTCVIVGAFIWGQHTAYGAATAPPQHWVDTALKIGACEQPSGRKGKWAGINWYQSHNHSFKGGLGMTNVLWDIHKRKGQPEDMHQATPIEQVWASWRFYKWADKTYPGYGHTGWVCSSMIGFRGFNSDGSWK
jgi:hypothetical protein